METVRTTVVSEGRLHQVWARLWSRDAGLAEGLHWLQECSPAQPSLEVATRLVDGLVVLITRRVVWVDDEAAREVNHQVLQRLARLRATVDQPEFELACLVDALGEVRTDLINLVDLFNEWELPDQCAFATHLLDAHEGVSVALDVLVRSQVNPSK